ncbi:heterokaryon incompatibility protein-domain-containing protein [Apiosordaria backusii]|uniref:Heterokaryon incompatibility protein-domain-containing protein n=1 Tax=Apiosordaria backusii TaxID=314023 RepID=A0AA40B752_9PEZI|nr:heterokaryon incompatibility protein-domain-containing protein [Apiosordaria backusii]
MSPARNAFDPEAMPTQASLSFDNPHICHHCSAIQLKLELKPQIYWCFGCSYNGPGKTTDKGDYVCSECARPFPGSSGVNLHYSSTLPYDLAQVLNAVESDGCEFYRWVVDRITRFFKIHEDPNGWNSEKALGLLSKTSRFELSGISIDDGRANLNISFFRRWAGDDSKENETWDRLGDFDAWATGDDLASKFILSRPYVLDVNSAQSMDFARSSFKTCMKSHPWCRTDQINHLAVGRTPNSDLSHERVDPKDIPTRLLDVGTTPPPGEDAGYIKLIETTVDDEDGRLIEKISRAGFTALSYCWGGDQKSKLVASNLQAYKSEGIKLSNLDQSLQDAVWVTRQVGIRYLWIDALCILQDDEDGQGNNPDKSHEISRMASYYGRATLTILAASASRAVDGFLQRRKPATKFDLAPTCVQFLWSVDDNNNDNKSGNNPVKVQTQIFLAKQPTDPVIEPITTRGWTLQESLLSRRILIFGLNQLYWSCLNSFAGCGGQITKLTDRVVPGIESLVPGVYPVGSLVDQPVDSQWNSIVKTYTRRFLSQPGDKLWAVSALASHIVQVSAHRGEKPAYAAGLLVDEANPGTWLQQLLWYPDSVGGVGMKRTGGKYRAPSWSWASVDGVVKVPSWSPRLEEYAIMKRWEVELAVKGALYGGLTGGYIDLRAMAQLISRIVEECSDVVWAERIQTEGSGDDDFDWTYTRTGGELEGTADRWVLMLVADSGEDRRVVETALRDPGPGVRILLVGLSSLSTGQLVGIRGIIVEQFLGDDDLETYKRRGSFRLKMGRHANGQPDLIAKFFEMATGEALRIL